MESLLSPALLCHPSLLLYAEQIGLSVLQQALGLLLLQQQIHWERKRGCISLGFIASFNRLWRIWQLWKGKACSPRTSAFGGAESTHFITTVGLGWRHGCSALFLEYWEALQWVMDAGWGTTARRLLRVHLDRRSEGSIQQLLEDEQTSHVDWRLSYTLLCASCLSRSWIMPAVKDESVGCRVRMASFNSTVPCTKEWTDLCTWPYVVGIFVILKRGKDTGAVTEMPS